MKRILLASLLVAGFTGSAAAAEWRFPFFQGKSNASTEQKAETKQRVDRRKTGSVKNDNQKRLHGNYSANVRGSDIYTGR